MKTKKRIELSMNIDELKQNWNSIGIPPEAPMPEVRELENKVASCRISTLRDRIYRLHLRLGIVGCLAILTLIPFAKDNPWMVVYGSLFFILMSVLHFSLAFWVHKLDYSRMTVKEALESVYKLEMRRNQNRIIGITLAVPLICYMFYTFAYGYDIAFLGGCVAGAVIGACIALTINRRAVMMLREMKRELRIDN